MDLWAILSSQGPREQPAIFAQEATDPCVAAVGLLRRSQHHLDGVSQRRPVSTKRSGVQILPSPFSKVEIKCHKVSLFRITILI